MRSSRKSGLIGQSSGLAVRFRPNHAPLRGLVRLYGAKPAVFAGIVQSCGRACQLLKIGRTWRPAARAMPRAADAGLEACSPLESWRSFHLYARTPRSRGEAEFYEGGARIARAG